MILSTTLSQSLALEIRPEPELQEKWDKRALSPFPLAPTVVVKSGFADYRKDHIENTKLGRETGEYVREDITEVRRNLPNSEFENGLVVHVGACRRYDCRYIRFALRKHLEIAFVDASVVVCNDLESYLDDLMTDGDLSPIRRPEVIHADIEKFVTAETIWNPSSTVLMYISRVLQHMRPNKFQSTLKGAAKFLRYPGRRLVIVHPFPKDNKRYEYSTSYEYHLTDFMDPLYEETEGRIKLARTPKKFSFYDGTAGKQVYTAFTLMCST